MRKSHEVSSPAFGSDAKITTETLEFARDDSNLSKMASIGRNGGEEIDRELRERQNLADLEWQTGKTKSESSNKT
jgi:hypothetical protein